MIKIFQIKLALPHVFLLFMLLTATQGFCAQGATLAVDIYGPGQVTLNVALSEPLGSSGANAPATGQQLNKLMQQNLAIVPFLNLIPGSSILGGNKLDGYTSDSVDFKRYQLAGADYLITAGWPEGSSKVELRALKAFTGELLVGRSYTDVSPKTLPQVADKFCEAFLEAMTGHGELFGSTIGFVRKTGKSKNIFTSRASGRNLRQVTKLEGYALSPSLSQDGRYIAFSYIDGRYHSLGILTRATGKTKLIRFKGNTIIGPCFTAGNTLALSMSKGENPNIYQLSGSFKIQRTLVQSASIDVSPSYNQSGTAMAYVSDRFGSPQIFTLSRGRVSFDGPYNTDPSMAPDGSFITYTKRTSEGYRIFKLDLATGQDTQLSFGPGSDEQPAVSPDGYFVAFTSTRAGGRQLFLTTTQGHKAKTLPLGQASFPTWGP